MNKIFLYGPPASGKTTVGKALAKALKVRFVDTDALICQHEGCDISGIFANKGEEYFRDAESKALQEACAIEEDCVVALGGGTLLRAANRELTEEKGAVICIEAPADEEIQARILASEVVRPLGNKAKERAPHYASFPIRLARFFELEESLVLVGEGLAQTVLGREKLLTDENVLRCHPELAENTIYTVKSGEEHKTPQTVMEMWSAMAKAGLGRKDRVAAVGGGVTGDMTGFAAATWMRGIDWINVPTTLLSMVDASTGGKTGCDLPEGKNLAGAFHNPKLVVIDTDFLRTLSPEIMRCGLAEMIKHWAIGGKKAFKGAVPTAGEIAENLSVKVGIVREDPFETKGRRMLLNCGHTIGHAVEKAAGYQMSHGEAVAIGCVEEARLAMRLGLADKAWTEELKAEFARAGLPTELPEGMTLEMLRETMRGDKKRSGNSVTFALPCGWGDVRAVKIDLGKELP